MKPILVFTNNSSIQKFRNSKNISEDSFDNRDFYLLNTKGIILGFNESSNKLENANDIKFNIYLINDKIEKEEFITNFNNTDEFFIIRHSKPEWGLFENDPNIIKGRHEPNGPHYDKLVEILCDDTNTEKHKTIVGTLFPNAEQKKEAADSLIIKLQLLHEIYDGKDYSRTSADKSLKEFSNKITAFDVKVPDKYKNDDKDHRAALIELRDALLADV